MRNFAYHRATKLSEALQAATTDFRAPPTSAPVQFLAGGTTLIDLMKLDVMQPSNLIDVNDLQQDYSQIQWTERELSLGAFARMSSVIEDATVKRTCPVITQSLELAASGQLRNMASLAGNVLQRTRCNYFRDKSYHQCNKRAPGSGCAALKGFTRKLAVLGVSDDCIAHYPGDFAQALVALDATAHMVSPRGRRSVPVEDLHCVPGDTPHIETILAADELITHFIIPMQGWYWRSMYLKIRDRQSYEFALVSVAVALELENGSVRSARIALGAVATKPWRARQAETVLVGNHLDEDRATAAAEMAFSGAITHGDNDFKPALGRRALVRALLECAHMEAPRSP